jgi:hypothetical protein
MVIWKKPEVGGRGDNDLNPIWIFIEERCDVTCEFK